MVLVGWKGVLKASNLSALVEFLASTVRLNVLVWRLRSSIVVEVREVEQRRCRHRDVVASQDTERVVIVALR